ncbi:MAG: alpha/beta hydrolase, partial [Blastocatellia bacterium]
NRVYEARFLISLRKTMREKDRLFPGLYDLRRMDRIRHLWDWDEEFQLHNGFDGARDSYARASSIAHLSRIRAPALIIHAMDDPFIPFEPFTDPGLTTNQSVLLAGTRHGGHVAFCGRGWPDEDRAWAENRAVEFCRGLAARMA